MAINYFCSLGHLCHASSFLKKIGFKKMSFPFDWVFSDLSIVIHCIEDDFATFLDKSHYIQLNYTKCAHKKYHDCMFNHHNPLNNKHHYDYFVRCVSRFRNLLASDKNKVFVITSTNHSIANEIDLTNLHKLNDTLKKYTKNYRILYIYHRVGKEQNHTFNTIDNLDILDIHTLSHSSGVNFYSLKDNQYLEKIFISKYKDIDLEMSIDV